MDYDNGFILQKVNWLLLNEGLAIPISVCSRFSEWDTSILQHGTSKQVKILIDKEFYDAKLINQNFDKRKYPNHRDIIQIRYTPNSLIAAKLRSVFQESYVHLYEQRQLEENRHRQLVLPSDINEYVRLYLTPSADVLCMECCTNIEYQHYSRPLLRGSKYILLGEKALYSINESVLMPLLYSVASAPYLLSLASFTPEPDSLTTRSAAHARQSTNDRQSSRTCHGGFYQIRKKQSR
jgi:hypothetical protein